MDEEIAFVIGSLENDHVSVRPVQRSYPEASDKWDRTWVVTHIDVRVGGFEGHVRADLRSEDFKLFHEALNRLFRELHGEAVFETMEGWLLLKVVGDGRGHFVTEGELTDSPGMGNRLSFELSFDQTEMPPMLRALEAILAAFPAS